MCEFDDGRNFHLLQPVILDTFTDMESDLSQDGFCCQVARFNCAVSARRRGELKLTGIVAARLGLSFTKLAERIKQYAVKLLVSSFD